MKLKTLIVAGAILSLSASLAQAEEGFYFNPTIGADIVMSDTSLKGDFDSVLEDRYVSGKIALGARVHDHLGFELSYASSDNGKESLANGNTKVDFDVWALDVMAYSPRIKENLELFGSVGVARYDYDLTANVTSPAVSLSGSEDDTALSLGFGGQYHFNEDWAARVAYKHSFVDISDSGSKIVDGVDEISIGVRYTF